MHELLEEDSADWGWCVTEPPDLKPIEEKIQAALPEWNVKLQWSPPSPGNGFMQHEFVFVRVSHKTKGGFPNHSFANELSRDFLFDKAFDIGQCVKSSLELAVRERRHVRKKRKAGK